MPTYDQIRPGNQGGTSLNMARVGVLKATSALGQDIVLQVEYPVQVPLSVVLGQCPIQALYDFRELVEKEIARRPEAKR